MMGIGIDFKKFCLFRTTAPYRTYNIEEEEFKFVANQRVKYTDKTAQFCFDFVVDAALKMQRLRFDIGDFIEKPSWTYRIV